VRVAKCRAGRVARSCGVPRAPLASMDVDAGRSRQHGRVCPPVSVALRRPACAVDPDYLRCCDGSTRHVAAVLSGVGVQEMARMVKVVYVAGPYSAPDSWHREQNIRRAETVATEIMALFPDVAVICVHTM